MANWRRKLGRPLLAVGMVLTLCIGPFTDVRAVSADTERPRRTQADTMYRGWITIDDSTIVATAAPSAMRAAEGAPVFDTEAVLIQPGESVQAHVHVPQAGTYAVVLDYRLADDLLIDSTAEVMLADKTVLTAVYGLWRDTTKTYALDRYGNEVTPDQEMIATYFQDYVRDSTKLDMEPVLFTLPAGDNIVTIKNRDQAISLRRVQLAAVAAPPSYAEYIQDQTMPGAQGLQIIEGEDYAVKSDSFIRVKAQQNAAVYPYDPYRKRLSTIDCGSYHTAGQRVVWNVSVPSDGWYHLALHYAQPDKEGQSVYRDIEIDGAVPFQELKEVGFAYTGNGYRNHVVTVGGEAARIYLTAGTHTIGLYTQAPALSPALEEIRAVIAELSAIGLQLQQVAGSSADRNRTWEIETYIPGVTGRLEALRQRLTGLYNEMGQQAGTTPASCINLKLAAGMIEQALKKPEKLPLSVSELSTGTGSATELLATLLNQIREQGIALDALYLYGEGETLPAESAGFFTSLWTGLQRFWYSLFHRDGAYSAGAVQEDVLNVWVNRSITYVETMQMMADAHFTPETGIEVRLSVMPDANKLLLANASKTCPDVALGLPANTPYQLALRGAAADFSPFDRLADMVGENFYAADLEPYLYDGKLYGLPETMQFYVLMYRTDILSALGLGVPDTWEDVAAMMPALRRSGMTFALPLSAYTGVKSLSSVVPFFFQAGASLYTDSGLNAAFQTEQGIRAFETLTDLYTLYSVQNNMPSFYNHFRYGTAPIGIGDFTNYMQILYAAPEIAELWRVAPAPGMADENGRILRQQTSVDRGAMILQDCSLREEAWRFLEWWLSGEVQTDFSHTLQVKFGPEFIWNSANKQAFAQLSLPSEDRSVILEQWQHAQNYRNTPATYMLERALSDAWYAVVNQGTPARIALNTAAVSVNEELQIKMKEFGYVDEKGRARRTYDMRPVEEILNGVSAP